jgi:hypothetical protein
VKLTVFYNCDLQEFNICIRSLLHLHFLWKGKNIDLNYKHQYRFRCVGDHNHESRNYYELPRRNYSEGFTQNAPITLHVAYTLFEKYDYLKPSCWDERMLILIILFWIFVPEVQGYKFAFFFLRFELFVLNRSIWS